MEKRGTSRTSRPTVHGRFAALDLTMGAQRSSVPTMNLRAANSLCTNPTTGSDNWSRQNDIQAIQVGCHMMRVSSLMPSV